MWRPYAVEVQNRLFDHVRRTGRPLERTWSWKAITNTKAFVPVLLLPRALGPLWRLLRAPDFPAGSDGRRACKRGGRPGVHSGRRIRLGVRRHEHVGIERRLGLAKFSLTLRPIQDGDATLAFEQESGVFDEMTMHYAVESTGEGTELVARTEFTLDWVTGSVLDETVVRG